MSHHVPSCPIMSDHVRSCPIQNSWLNHDPSNSVCEDMSCNVSGRPASQSHLRWHSYRKMYRQTQVGKCTYSPPPPQGRWFNPGLTMNQSTCCDVHKLEAFMTFMGYPWYPMISRKTTRIFVKSSEDPTFAVTASVLIHIFHIESLLTVWGPWAPKWLEPSFLIVSK